MKAKSHGIIALSQISSAVELLLSSDSFSITLIIVETDQTDHNQNIIKMKNFN